MAIDTRIPDAPELRGGRGRLASRPDDNALGPYIRAVRGHWLIWLLVLLTTVGAGLAWLTVRSPDYKASAEFFIRPIPEEEQTLITLPVVRDTGDPTRTIQTAAELIDSNEAHARVARRLGAGWTSERVEKNTHVSPEGQTDIVSIEATA